MRWLRRAAKYLRKKQDDVAALRAMPYKQYLRTKHWRELRKRVLKRDRYQCQRCSSKKRLEIHHKTYMRLGCEWMRDLVTLCHICHSKHHGKRP